MSLNGEGVIHMRQTAGWGLVLLLSAQECPRVPEPNDLKELRSIAGVRRGLATFVKTTGTYPDRLEDLCPNGPPCEYLNSGANLLDPWGTPLVYSQTSKDFEIRSAGRDRRAYSADDRVFTFSGERAGVQDLGGCYEVEEPAWWSDTLRFESAEISAGGAYRLNSRSPLAG